MLLHQACCIWAVSIRQVRVCADNTVSDRCWRIRSGSFCNLQYEIIQHLLIKLCYRLKLLNSIIQKRYLKHIFLFMKENFNLSFSKFKIRNYLSIVSSWMDKEGGGVGRPLLPGWPTAEKWRRRVNKPSVGMVHLSAATAAGGNWRKRGQLLLNRDHRSVRGGGSVGAAGGSIAAASVWQSTAVVVVQLVVLVVVLVVGCVGDRDGQTVVCCVYGRRNGYLHT